MRPIVILLGKSRRRERFTRHPNRFAFLRALKLLSELRARLEARP